MRFGEFPADLITVRQNPFVGRIAHPKFAAVRLAKKYRLWLKLVTRSPYDKYLLCRPQGGWNDTLVQVANCFAYALKYNRRLIVDTSRSGLLDDLDRYFRPPLGAAGVHFRVFDAFRNSAQSLSCFPNILFGKGINYTSRFDTINNYIEVTTGQQLTFDMSRDYEQKLLIHEQCGGGDESVSFFEWAVPSRLLREEICRRLRPLPHSYIALHVRHSDVATDYHRFFEAVRPIVRNSNVLMCTDSLEVLMHARDCLKNSTVFSVSKIPDAGGQSLHHNPRLTDWSVNVGALTDLAAMSKATAIIHPAPSIGYPSGFVALAANLMASPPL